MKQSRRWRGLLVAVALAVVACGGGDDGGDGDATVSDSPTGPLWSNEDVHAVSHPMAAGGNAVVQVADGGELFTAGYDPATGEERWRTPSAALVSSNLATIYPNFRIPARPLVVEETVVHLAPADVLGQVHVEAVDGETGEVVWRTEHNWEMLVWLGLCSDRGDRVCVAVTEPDHEYQANVPVLWAVDMVDGAVDQEFTGRMTRTGNPWNTVRRPDVLMARPPGSSQEERWVAAPDLDPAEPPRGEMLWERSWQELFGDLPLDPSEGSGTRVFWTELEDVLVGSVDVDGASQPENGPGEIVHLVTSGVEPDSGEVLWTVPGTGECGEVSELYLDVEGLAAEVEATTDTILRCELDGTVERADDGSFSYDADSTFSQVDVHSGDVLWTADVPGFVYLDGAARLVRLDPTTFAGERGDGSLVALDLASGELRDAQADEVGWCFSTNEYRYDAASVPAGEEPVFDGAPFTQPCDLAGEPQPAPAAADEGIGAEADGTFVWMDANGLHGAEL